MMTLITSSSRLIAGAHTLNTFALPKFGALQITFRFPEVTSDCRARLILYRIKADTWKAGENTGLTAQGSRHKNAINLKLFAFIYSRLVYWNNEEDQRGCFRIHKPPAVKYVKAPESWFTPEDKRLKKKGRRPQTRQVQPIFYILLVSSVKMEDHMLGDSTIKQLQRTEKDLGG